MSQPARISRLTQDRFKPAEDQRNVWVVRPESGVALESIVGDESYFAHIAKVLRPSDRIEVIPDDGSYFAILYVVNAMPVAAKTVVLQKIDLQSMVPAEELPEGYDVQWAGPHHKFRVLRKRDNVVLKKELPSQSAARAWLLEYQATMKAA